MLTLIAAAILSTSSLEDGIKAIDALDTQGAVSQLEKARGEGPYDLTNHIRLYEHLAIAYAYVGRTEEAVKAFEQVLALSPGHAVSYTLSPKVTFLFEKARQLHAAAPQLSLEVSWPRDMKGGRRLPVTIENRVDSRHLLGSFKLFSREKGAAGFDAQPVAAPAPGQSLTLELPEVAPAVNGSVTRELYGIGFDAAGNEVFRWASGSMPRDVTSIPLITQAWYQRWYVWAAIVVVLAGTSATVAYFATRPLSPTVGGSFQLQ